MIAMDLPEAKGTYVLVAFVAQMKRLEIGHLGAYDIVPGYYAYVGSAFGAGGLRARIGHHLESTASPHWHIDYLLGVAEPRRGLVHEGRSEAGASLGGIAGKGSAFSCADSPIWFVGLSPKPVEPSVFLEGKALFPMVPANGRGTLRRC